MTEQDWLACEDPQRMLAWYTRPPRSARPGEAISLSPYAQPISCRKLRLFACACVRQVWHLLAGRSRGMVEAAERMADGEVTQGAVYDASELAGQVCGDQVAAGMSNSDPLRLAALAAYWCAPHTHRDTVNNCVMATTRYVADINEGPGTPSHADWMRAMAHALRCIIGNPFRPVKVSPAVYIPHLGAWDYSSAESWLTPTVVSLATAAYDERTDTGRLDPVRLAVLADAMEEAGAEGAILTHLRDPGPHWRGCWAIDALAGKE